MNMKNRIIFFLLAVIISLGLFSSCGKNEEETSSSPMSNESTSQEETTEEVVTKDIFQEFSEAKTEKERIEVLKDAGVTVDVSVTNLGELPSLVKLSLEECISSDFIPVNGTQYFKSVLNFIDEALFLSVEKWSNEYIFSLTSAVDKYLENGVPTEIISEITAYAQSGYLKIAEETGKYDDLSATKEMGQVSFIFELPEGKAYMLLFDFERESNFWLMLYNEEGMLEEILCNVGM